MRWLRPWVFPAAADRRLRVVRAPRRGASGSDALAPPSAAAKAFTGAALDGSLWQATGFTLGTAALGLLLGAVLGIALGLVLGLVAPRGAARLAVRSRCCAPCPRWR